VAAVERHCLGAELGPGERPFLRRRLRHDAGLRAEVEAATDLAIPVSKWRGAEVEQATTYEYAEDGRLIRSVTVSSPEWTDDDRALVLALREEQANTCPMCGHPMDECRDPATARTWRVHEEICQAGRVAQAIADNRAEEHVRGLHIYTSRTGG